jgi:hypothetical protein
MNCYTVVRDLKRIAVTELQNGPTRLYRHSCAESGPRALLF